MALSEKQNNNEALNLHTKQRRGRCR